MPLTYSIAYGLIAGIGFAMIIGVTEIFFGLFGCKIKQDEPLHPASAFIRSKMGFKDVDGENGAVYEKPGKIEAKGKDDSAHKETTAAV